MRAADNNDNGYRALAAEVIRQAIDDWDTLCSCCAKGVPCNLANVSFESLDLFFERYADFYNIMELPLDKMVLALHEKRDEAIRRRDSAKKP